MTVVINGTSGVTFPVTAGGTSATQASSGKVLQVVQATYSTSTNSTSATYADTGLTASITPSASTSKVLVIVSQQGCGKYGDNAFLEINIVRNSTEVWNGGDKGVGTNSTAELWIGSYDAVYLDSPATTSSTTYKTQFKNVPAVGTVRVQSNNGVSTITLMEIAA